MNIEKFALPREEAYEKWKAYVAACKTNPSSTNEDMKKVYNQLKSGRKVVDIFKVIQRGGVNHEYEPRLAVGRANHTMIYCDYYTNGSLRYVHHDEWWRHTSKKDVSLPIDTLPRYDGVAKTFSCAIPTAPANLQPKKMTADYYVLWEVEKWDAMPDRDPYLLRRITPNMFVIVAAWELTDLEISVISGRAH